MKNTDKYKEERSRKHAQSPLIKITAVSIGAFLSSPFFCGHVSLHWCVCLYFRFFYLTEILLYIQSLSTFGRLKQTLILPPPHFKGNFFLLFSSEPLTASALPRLALEWYWLRGGLCDGSPFLSFIPVLQMRDRPKSSTNQMSSPFRGGLQWQDRQFAFE